jgi:hypothetical protein
MPYPPELLRHQVVAVGASLLLSFAGVASLVHGFRSGEDSSAIFVAFGTAALPIGALLGWLSTSWYRRAAKLVSSGQQVAAIITLVAEADLESTTLYAEVGPVGKIADRSLRVAVLTPHWEYRSFLGTPLGAGLFVEPSSSRLMAISTQLGVLWCIPHNVSAKGVGAA